MHTLRELPNSYEMAKIAIDSMVDYAVFILDESGKILTANSGCSNLFGFSSEEVIDTHFARLFTMEEVFFQMTSHYENETWFARKDGTEFWGSIVINKLSTDVGSYLGHLLIITDLTVQKNNEEKLRSKADIAHKELQLKAEYIANISHEIRTPLGAILGFAEFLQKDTLSDDERDHYLDIILKNVKNLNHLINDVLDLSKIDAGKLDIELVQVDLEHTINEVLELFQPQCALKKINLSYLADELAPKMVTTDANRLRQILNNIIGNAVKFTENGNIVILAKVIKEGINSDQVEIQIQDTGVGFSEEDVMHIFHPFVQVGRGKCSDKEKGTGLGLVLARKTAEALGGDVKLTNTTLGKGSVFNISFTNFKAAPIKIKSEELLSNVHSLKEKSILIVDDSVDNLEIIKLFLNSYGGEPDTAFDGNEALRKIKLKKYDVILMDIEMPDMNGFQVIRELHHLNNKTPVIALTAHAMPEDRIRTKNAGFCDHITKPIDFNYLVSKIEMLH